MQRTPSEKPDFRRRLLPALLSAGALTLVLAAAAHAQSGSNFGLNTAAGNTIPTTTDLTGLLGKLLRTALQFVGTLFLLLMIYAGFIYMTARGDSKKIGEAKNMMTGAVIGVIIIASAYAITSFVLGAVTTGGGGSSAQTAGTVGLHGACTTGADCSAGLQCSFSTASPNKACLSGSGGTCSADPDCLGSLHCLSGKCG